MTGNLTRLNSILNRMDIPQERRFDWHWLLRNLGIRNGQHKDYREAMSILKELVRGR